MVTSFGIGRLLRRSLVALGWLGCLAGLAAAAPGAVADYGLTARIPVRPAAAPTGHELLQLLAALPPIERDTVIVDQLLAGNLPDSLRSLQPVRLSPRVQIFVMPDYLAVGSDADSVRVALGLAPALQVAERLGFILPTPRMVDAIYAQAAVQLAPRPLRPSPRMSSVAYLAAHERTIAAQCGNLAPGQLVAGHKKDLVLSRRLERKPDRVAIYGWHRPDGSPIQPLSTVHGERYRDYSHGLRLVSTTALVDGQPRSIFDLFEDQQTVDAVTAEGISDFPRRLLQGHRPPPVTIASR